MTETEPECIYIPYKNTAAFSDAVLDYLDELPALRPFRAFTPDEAGADKALQACANYDFDRQRLVCVLRRQYEKLTLSRASADNLELLLLPNTFTITTAHQPNLLGGYLYFFYKILHVVRMAEAMRERHPANNFVPVYYMGGEDNDLEELGKFNFNGKAYVWDGGGQAGAVGRMKTKTLKPLLNELFGRMGPQGETKDALTNLLQQAYLEHETIGEATSFLVNELFGKYGLLILNPDDAELKEIFVSVMRADIFEGKPQELVNEQSEALQAAGYKPQAFARPINLFYLIEGMRQRIEQKGPDEYIVLNSEIRFTKSELEAELNKHPERFSPNVILRGLFQQTVLPNIVFVGGGSELAYWLQLRSVFDHYKVFFPQLMLRQSVHIVEKPLADLMDKLQLSPGQWFTEPNQLLRSEIARQDGNTWSLAGEREAISTITKHIAARAEIIDATLAKSAAAMQHRMEALLKNFEQKMFRAEKRRHDVLAQRITALHEQLRPGGGLQERRENFITFYLSHGFAIFDAVKEAIKPFSNEFMLYRPAD